MGEFSFDSWLIYVVLGTLIDFVLAYRAFVIPFALLALGYAVGTVVENRHLDSLRERERLALHLPTATYEETDLPAEAIADARLVSGVAVISIDRFKLVVGALRYFFGGVVPAHETLIDRARREALVRMRAAGADAVEIVCVRLSTANIASGAVEAIAYGTAIYRKPA